MARASGLPSAAFPSQAARCSTTAKLLQTLSAGGELAPADVEAIARVVDDGSLIRAAQSPLSVSHGVSQAAEELLAAALELARRASLPRVPSALRGPEDLARIAIRELGGRNRERVIVVVCDASNRPMTTLTVTEGAVDRALFPVPEILNAVLRWDGRAFALAHNHPFARPDPSEADRLATRRIADAARIVGLRFLGHVIVGSDGWATVTT